MTPLGRAIDLSRQPQLTGGRGIFARQRIHLGVEVLKAKVHARPDSVAAHQDAGIVNISLLRAA